ncbi:MAG TPA: hypothetical protein VLJ59_16555 [Mycobacteriales bacterium]|nr:hypothetical protein [Mycobacteriales bacterium]
MTGIDLAEVATTLGRGPAVFIDSASPLFSQVPDRWRSIAAAGQPQDRCTTALSLWNTDFCALVPRFSAALATKLVDVRVCHLRGEWVLVYVAPAFAEPHATWIGHLPADTQTPPASWSLLPEPVQDFLSTVHGGFTAPDGESYGVIRPSDMVSYVRWATGSDEPDPDWDEGQPLSSARMTFIGKDGGLTHYCVSPDLPPGQVALVYEGEIDPGLQFGPALDDCMMGRFEG